VAKLPEFCRKIPWLDECFPDALFLHITRDWRPLVSSMLQKGKVTLGGGVFGTRRRAFRPREGEPDELTAVRQLLEVDEILSRERARLGARFKVLSYEDLCTEPKGTLESLFRTCELACDADLIAGLAEGIRPLSDRWRAILTPEKIAGVREALGDTLLGLEHPIVAGGDESPRPQSKRR
jgi:hypothetical protein